ncbi:MAG: HAD family hydrolase [Candidatus Woesearchaeota archaeon]
MPEKKNITKTKLVIFDYDGVLVDTLAITIRAYNHLLRDLNLSKQFTKDEFKDYCESDWISGLSKIGLHKKEEQQKCAEFYFRYLKDYGHEIQLCPGIKKMLEKLKQKGYSLAIASNNKFDEIKTRLLDKEIDNYFDYIIDDTHGLKPNPAGILALLAHLNIKPEHAVLVGDMDGDMLAAKNANLKKAIGVTWGYHHPEKLNCADIIIDSPEELIDVVD